MQKSAKSDLSVTFKDTLYALVEVGKQIPFFISYNAREA